MTDGFCLVRPKPTLFLFLLVSCAFAAPAVADGHSPLEVAARFLELTPEQVEQTVAIRAVTAELVAPIVEQIAARRAALDSLLESDGASPAEIGVLVLALRALERQASAAQAAAAAEIRALLDPTQRARLALVAEAAPLCPAVPALSVLHLL